MISYMWNLKHGTNEPIYETERLTDIENRLVVAKGKGRGRQRGGEGTEWEFGISKGKLLPNRTDKQQSPIVEHKELHSIRCDKPQWKRI